MRKYVLIILILVVSMLKICGQQRMLSGQDSAISSIITRYYQFKDPNPLYQDESDSCYRLMTRVLSFRKISEAEDSIMQIEIFRFLYENSINVYEDVIDGYRMSVRRSILFAALSLLADEYRYNLFLSYATYALEENTGEMKYKYIILIELVGLMKDIELFGVTSNTYKIRIERIKSLFSAHKDQLDKGFANELEIQFFK